MKKEIKISLAAARVNAGLTQSDIAREMHINKSTVVNWEKGRITPKPAQYVGLTRIIFFCNRYNLKLLHHHTSEKGGRMWKAEIKKGTLYLNGEKVPYVSEITIEKISNQAAILNLSMTVETKNEIELQQEQHWKLSVRA